MKNSKPKILPASINNEEIPDIKSPIFVPRPGWGGKLKIWFSERFESGLLPVISLATLAAGLYLVFIK